MRQGVWGSLEAPSGSQTGPSGGLERSPQGTQRFKINLETVCKNPWLRTATDQESPFVPESEVVWLE